MKNLTHRMAVLGIILTSAVVIASARASTTAINLGSILFPPGEANMQAYQINLDATVNTVVATPSGTGDAETFSYNETTGKGLAKIQQTLFTVDVNEANPAVTFTQFVHSGEIFYPQMNTTATSGASTTNNIMSGSVNVDGLPFDVVINQNFLPWVAQVSMGGVLHFSEPILAQSNYAAIVSGDVLFAIEPNAPTPGSFQVHKWLRYRGVNSSGSYTVPSSPSNVAHIVISEVQITGGTGASHHDFIELYNPTNQAINLSGFRLVRRSTNAIIDSPIKSWGASTTASIPAHGFYLWANSGYTTISTQPDTTTGMTIADNTSVALKYGSGSSTVIIDAVTWGRVRNGFGEGRPLSSGLSANQSLERKVWQGITCFAAQGVGALLGNGCDRDTNSLDFNTRAVSQPQNSSSPLEP